MSTGVVEAGRSRHRECATGGAWRAAGGFNVSQPRSLPTFLPSNPFLHRPLRRSTGLL